MRQRPRFLSRLLCLLLVFCTLLPQTTFAAVRTTALETAQWNTVAEASIIDEGGWLQSMCATDQYIVCLINASRNGTEPDTLIAFYRNTTDPQGNPVKQYSYAFHVTQMDFEHGNGMTYNPNTREIAIAGLFNNGKNNRGAVFIVDADTLQFKRKVTVGNGKWNFFGIDYVAEKDQYVLMANRPADYSFIFTDGNFQVTDTLNLGLSSSRSSFQDFCVVGDSIISIPYMQRDGFMNVVDVYSISQKARVGSYYLTLPDSAFSVEPEGICQLESGHFLMASAVKGSTVFKPIFPSTTPSLPALKTAPYPSRPRKWIRAAPVPLPTARRRISVCRNWWWTALRWIPQRIPTVTPSPMYRKITLYRRFTRKSPATPSLPRSRTELWT